jgi:hypothetical protein
MDKTTLEARIEQRAKDRFQQDFEDAITKLASNPILSDLVLKCDGGKEMRLVSTMGHCPAKDLFFRGSFRERKNLLEHTNIEGTEEYIVKKYIQEETDGILSKLSVLAEYLQND